MAKRLLPSLLLFGLLHTGGPVGAAVPDLADLGSGAVIRDAQLVAERDGMRIYRKEVLSDVYHLDRIYRSMRGPSSAHPFTLLDGEPELLWLVGYEAEMTEPDGNAELPPDYMCHSNLDVDQQAFLKRFPTEFPITGGRLFTLSQGQLEVELPRGFGVPIMSDMPIQLTAQVLNHNDPDADLYVRQRIRLDFVRDSELVAPLQPLIDIGVYGLKVMEGEDGHFGVPSGEVDESIHGTGCLPGQHVDRSGHIVFDGKGRKFTAFWVVPPGREENHTRVTSMLNLPADTRVHYIAVHLHPFAESIELRDLTTGESVYKAVASQTPKRIGLAEVHHYSSQEGLPLYRGHEYELVSIYDNTSGHDQDAMATMLLYVRPRDMYDFYFRRR